MKSGGKRLKLPTAVLERARAAATVSASKPQVPSAPPKRRVLTPREKVVAALKKLHPMD
ncbi:MAG: hypothetical protein QM817_18935 [Archangium sp.]